MREQIGKEEQIEELARQLEEPRALRLLAEWLAIEHDKTRLQGDEYMEAAQELYDYLLIIGFRLIPPLIEEIKKVENPNSDNGIGADDVHFSYSYLISQKHAAFEEARQKIIKRMEGGLV